MCSTHTDLLWGDAEGCLAYTTATKNIFSTAVLFQAPNDPGYPGHIPQDPGVFGRQFAGSPS